MVEPLGFSSALQVASLALSYNKQLMSLAAGIRTSPHETTGNVLAELPSLLSILNDIKESSIHTRSPPPQSVLVAMETCNERFLDLSRQLKRVGIDPQTGLSSEGASNKIRSVVRRAIKMEYAAAPLEEAMKRFRSALYLLRDMTMDLRTHDLLEQQRIVMEDGFNQIFEALRDPERVSRSMDLDTGLEIQPEPVTSRSRFSGDPGQSSSLFNASISLDPAEGERPIFYTAKAMLDSGCPDNLISEALVKRCHLETRQEAITSRTYTGHAGAVGYSEFQLKLNWSADNETLLRTNYFYVLADSIFELSLGNGFIEENLDFFNRTIRKSFMFRLGNRDKKTKAVEALNSTAKDKIQGKDLVERRRAEKERAAKAASTSPNPAVNTERPKVMTTNAVAGPTMPEATGDNTNLAGQSQDPLPDSEVSRTIKKNIGNGRDGVIQPPGNEAKANTIAEAYGINGVSNMKSDASKQTFSEPGIPSALPPSVDTDQRPITATTNGIVNGGGRPPLTSKVADASKEAQSPALNGNLRAHKDSKSEQKES